ncbi:5-formyltetrahydrofolate cyclo-ligase [Thermodesulfatator indicus DSM 15286]|uniref:5-formyltetrahydrofolate cyclo-ligase n=1 Tax=Thermodesulfatator indicus (strain DSM 15286 / JCM 11887 / CIR29812) TaxID=667014 RepID=F8A8C8_THEID|nr:5-formyltetrahydrofolate cyclo-ligase [Thermodesulfatator indicus]AEH43932.1 5-formyltetrahydrofolate cyclo-ligase [Thermodesulfatator indicus DSM 15286]
MKSIKQHKKKLRKNFLTLRDSLSGETRKSLSQKIAYHLQKSIYYEKAQKILFYASFKSEVETYELIQKALTEGKEVYLPKTYISEHKLRLFKIKSLKELKPGAYGIPEPPENNPEIMPHELDLIILPGVAFDLSGGRLGYGGGFYDRLLAKAQDITKIALAFECQLVKTLPLEAHDLRVNAIVTEKGLKEIF